jgi:hypothetical protein
MTEASPEKEGGAHRMDTISPSNSGVMMMVSVLREVSDIPENTPK